MNDYTKPDQYIPDDDVKFTNCIYCNTPIWWMEDENGKRIPMKPRNGRHLCKPFIRIAKSKAKVK